jgi:hypothetical protein
MLLKTCGAIGLFIPLGEWAVQGQSLLRSLASRAAFRHVSEQELGRVAEQGKLVLLLDGWNELDASSRARLRAELGRMRRELPRLRIVISTRRQVLDVPINGPKVEVEPLTEDQQLEIARALAGEAGEVIVDRAWRTAGVRELVAIPLYLDTLLHRAPQGAMPSTREEVLRFFVEEHEQTGEHIEALRQTLFDCHKELLTALAACAMRAGTVTLPEAQARAAVNDAGKALETAGLMKTAPEPAVALGALVDHHLLIRVGQDGGLAFQHQQFQEWYASFEVERTIRQRVLRFIDAWHSPGRVDRAVRFMIISGREEFSSRIWPLVTSADQQVYLSALRAARRFRPSVLGNNPGPQIAALPQERSEAILGEIASNSGFDGMDLATALAKADPSADVRVEVISSLQFRRGDRHVAELLADAPEEVWSQMAAKGYPDRFADPQTSERLRRARERELAKETNLARRLGMLVAVADDGETVEPQITDVMLEEKRITG